MPYPQIYRFTAAATEPHGAARRPMFADELSDAALDAALDALGQASSPFIPNSGKHLRFVILNGARAE